MSVRELAESEYNVSWHGSQMRNVTETAEEVLDIWPYVREVLTECYPHVDHGDADVYRIYESLDRQIHHVYINVGIPNLHLVVVVSVCAKAIEGHFHLNLGKL